jgi:hypothetical protein
MPKSDIEIALQALIGRPLWMASRVVDLEAFGFGDHVHGPGQVDERPEFWLHVQCRWRIVRDGSVLVGAADIFWPPAGAEVSYRDFDYDGKRSRREELLDDFVKHGEAAHVVKHAEGAATGDACLTFGDGCVLELWPDHRSGVEGNGPFEHWRFFRVGGPEHFVMTVSGIEP